LKETILFMRSMATTASPLAATAPADRPVRPPEGTNATLFSLAMLTIACTSSTVSGNNTTLGAGSQTLVQSVPYCCALASSVKQRGEPNNGYNSAAIAA